MTLEDEAPIIRLTPSYKDYLWGGTLIKKYKNKNTDLDIVAESWELSAHNDGQSVIASGIYKGLTFLEYLEKCGKKVLGTNAANFTEFPILIKLIDAQKPLSVQVHPTDEYARKVEGEYGKNEMWHIIDAKEDSYIYYGLKHFVTKEEIRKRIEDGTLEEILNKVYVKEGDTFFVSAGTIHAIGSGILICEIQQSSNSTYRLYDYNRVDANGKKRDLHIDKALDVIDIEKNVEVAKKGAITGKDVSFGCKRLVESKYFVVDYYEKNIANIIKVDETSFAAIVILEGSGKLYASDGHKIHQFNAGDTFFINATNREIMINGATKFIVVKI